MVELILLLITAVVVGIIIHLLVSRRSKLKGKDRVLAYQQEAYKWKSKYDRDVEVRDREIMTFRQKLKEAEEQTAALSKKAEDLRHHNTEIEAVISQLEKKLEDIEKDKDKGRPVLTPVSGAGGKAEYIEQLLLAQSRLMEQNDKIKDALSSLEVLREKEEKQKQILQDNAVLAEEIKKLKQEMNEKEAEINTMKQKEHLTKEMTTMLDSAYGEFNVLQLTIKELESKLTASKKESLGYEDIKAEHRRLMQEVEDYKRKAASLSAENHVLQQELTSVRDMFRESDYQRQQLQKRITHLDELNKDLQLVADANKKLESQLQQIGKIENMLNDMAEERSGLMQQKDDE